MEKITLNEELIILNLKAVDWEDALTKISDNLFVQNIVKESFTDAIVKREKKFPTGLQGSKVGVAIPHTDAEHVKVQAMSVAVLEKPVSFTHMGADDLEVDVSIIFMLAMNGPEKQVEMLPKLMEIFQKEDVLESIKTSNNKKNIKEIIFNELDIDLTTNG